MRNFEKGFYVSNSTVEHLSIGYKLNPTILIGLSNKNKNIVEVDNYYNSLNLEKSNEIPSRIYAYHLLIKNKLKKIKKETFEYIFF